MIAAMLYSRRLDTGFIESNMRGGLNNSKQAWWNSIVTTVNRLYYGDTTRPPNSIFS